MVNCNKLIFGIILSLVIGIKLLSTLYPRFRSSVHIYTNSSVVTQQVGMSRSAGPSRINNGHSSVVMGQVGKTRSAGPSKINDPKDITEGHDSPNHKANIKSAFIYTEPNGIKLISLSYHCSTCKLRCKNLTDGIANTCVGKQCLCNRDSPTISYSKLADNSARADDYMIEAEKQTLLDEIITESTRLPNITKTEITKLTGNKALFVGDQIQILIKLVDNSGQYLKRGGDDVRVWMIEKKQNMRIAGRVQDNNNGTYLVTVPALWPGNNSVVIAIPYFREESATIFRWYRQFYTLYYHYGTFSGKTSQQTLCAITPNITGYKDVCDLSFHNGGEPWYCGKPPSPNLTCDDITVNRYYMFRDIGVTTKEFKLFRRIYTQSGRKLKIPNVLVKGTDAVKTNLPKCNDLQARKTWDLSLPTGYFNGSRYRPTTCRVSDAKPNISSRLLNTTMVLTGDSTSLQWFKILKRYSRCTLVPHKWSMDKTCVHETICVNNEWKFTLKFVPNNMPFVCFHVQPKPYSKITATKSMSTILDEIPGTGRHIFVFHMYAHYTLQHYNVFRDKIIRCLQSLRKALKRNTDLSVVVKGPHIYYYNKGRMPSIQDFLGRHIISILLSEMKEFSDRVVFLDYWDMSVAIENTLMHLPANIIWNQIELLADFVN